MPNLFIKTSKEPRVLDTTAIVIQQLPTEQIKKHGSGEILDNFQISRRLYPSFYGKKLLADIITDMKASSLSEVGYITSFLKGKEEIKPKDIALPYLKEIGKWFGIYDQEYKGKKVKWISFRHGEKGTDGKLTDIGKVQAQKLGKDINKDELEGYDYVHLLGTHNMLNESIVLTLFGIDKLEGYNYEPLGFAEKVIYELYEKDSESYLKIKFKGNELEISYKDFQKRLKFLQS